MASYNVNYNDQRFKNVETEKQAELDKYNQTYDRLIEERNQFTNQQQGLVDQWEDTQRQIANDNLNHQLELYNQQKDKADREYQKEAKASYIDYQKEVDKYGVSRENVVQNGLSNSGYSESSKVDMYNTYQNRVATARESLNNIKLEFDNAIKEAQLQNNAKLAENALTALQQKLSIALEGFGYKTEQENNRLNWDYNINNTYYDRYKNVESQINYENEQAEKIRQFNEQMAYQKKQQELEQQRWEKEYALQQAQAAASRSYGGGGGPYSSGGDYPPITENQQNALTTAYYSGSYNKDALTNGQVDKNKVFSNGYQPNNVNGNKLTGYQKSGKQVYVDVVSRTLQGTKTTTKQKVWKDTKGNLWVWDGTNNKYVAYKK